MYMVFIAKIGVLRINRKNWKTIQIAKVTRTVSDDQIKSKFYQLLITWIYVIRVGGGNRPEINKRGSPFIGYKRVVVATVFRSGKM